MSAKSERKRRHKAKMRRRARRAAAIEHTVSRLFALMESLREPVEEIGRRMRWGVGYAAQ